MVNFCDEEIPTQIKCSDCGKIFKNLAKLNSHRQVVHATGSFPCDICSKEFKNKDYLRNHVRQMHASGEDTMEMCDQCPKIFKNKNQIYNHKKAVHSTEVHTCKKCSAIYKSGRSLRKHFVKCKKENTNQTATKVEDKGQEEFSNEANNEDISINLSTEPVEISNNENTSRDNEVGHIEDKKEMHGLVIDKNIDVSDSDFQVSNLEGNNCEVTESGTELVHLEETDDIMQFKKEYEEQEKSLEIESGLDSNLDDCQTTDEVEHKSEEIKSEDNLQETVDSAICDVCSKDIPSSKLRSHIRNYHSGENLKCEQCDKSFGTLKYFKTHVRSVHSSVPRKPNLNKTEKTEICEVCSNMFSKYKIKEHMRNVHGNDGGNCPTCGRFFATSRYLKNHMNQRHLKKESEETVQLCEFCTEECVASKMRAHVRNYHSSENLNCDECGKTYNNRKYFRAHVKMVHSGNIALCQICTKTFSNNHYLRQHIRLIHESTEDSAQCDICCKSFKNNNRLHGHVNAVHRNKDSPCPVCNKTYKNTYLLRKHEKKYHTVVA